MGVVIKEFRTPRGNQFLRAYQSVTSIFKIIRDIREFDPDVIHSQSPYMTFIPWLMRKKFTTTIHILYLKRNLKFKNPTHLIAISNESYEFSKRVFGMEDENITLIHHGVSDRYGESISQEEKLKLKHRLNINVDKLIIGYAGSVSMRKGCDILVESLKNLSEETKKKIHFIFLGEYREAKRTNGFKKW
ncbi:glycosyltransferase [Maribacter halichondriae]|uniref:glycosyltransferase n=1 Tax=Maribacter halichondriae TaxID=2980554 RepID=UPI00235878CD|nr:glycosyltransferase [Maribacter sp. Hal144]